MNAYDDVVMIPKEEEIKELEGQLESLKKMREDAKQRLLENVRMVIDELPGQLEGHEILKLINSLEKRLHEGHKGTRGSPVPDSMKKNLEQALMDSRFAIKQLAKMFGLSASYIYRFRKKVIPDHGFNSPARA